MAAYNRAHTLIYAQEGVHDAGADSARKSFPPEAWLANVKPSVVKPSVAVQIQHTQVSPSSTTHASTRASTPAYRLLCS